MKLKNSFLLFIFLLSTFSIFYFLSSLDEGLKLSILKSLNFLLPEVFVNYLITADLSKLIIYALLLLGLFLLKKYWIKYFKNINFANLFNSNYVPNKKNYDILIYVTYIYVFWRMLSRNYGVYSFTAGYYLGVPRLYLNFSQLEIKPYELVSLQFIHRFFPVPSYDFILNFQIFTAVLCVAGMYYKYSKTISGIIFLNCMYLTGFVLMTNAELEATEIMLFALLTIVVNNFRGSNNFSYGLIGFQWFVGFYYLSSGINKLVDVGISFIWNLNIDEFRYVAALESMSLSSRYANYLFTQVLIHPLVSDFFGFMTILIELGFVLLFLNNKYAIFPLFGAILLHTSVYLMAGINFTGNSFFLIYLIYTNISNNKKIRKKILKIHP